MRRSGNKLINIFLVIIIIINLFASIFIIFGEKKVKEKEVFEIGNFDEFIEVYKVGPSPEKYRDFVESLVNERFDELYNNTKALSDSQLKQYYEKENTLGEQAGLTPIQSKYGISNYETFDKLVKELRQINEKGAKYKKSNIVKKSCKVGLNYTTSQLVLKYSKFQKLTLTIEMANSIQYDTQTFKISVKEEK